MASPVKLYHQEMHKNLGYFAAWLPSSELALGDIGVLEAGRFRKQASLKELKIPYVVGSEGTPVTLSYSSAASRKPGLSAGARTPAAGAKASLSIAFTSEGAFVFEALNARSVEIANRTTLADGILQAFAKGIWHSEWLVVESVYAAAFATIIVSEDRSSEIVLEASADVPLGSLPLADPKLGLTVSSTSGKIIHVVGGKNLRPLYSCVKVRDSLFREPSLVPVRGLEDQDSVQALARPGIEDLLNS